MRFEAIGIEPVYQEGEYFENDMWWWPRLWDFIWALGGNMLTTEQHIGVMLNRHIKISRWDSDRIANQLFLALDDTKHYQKLVDQNVGACEVTEICICRAKRISTQSFIGPHRFRFQFDWDNVYKFAVFCRYSGGFMVCCLESVNDPARE